MKGECKRVQERERVLETERVRPGLDSFHASASPLQWSSPSGTQIVVPSASQTYPIWRTKGLRRIAHSSWMTSQLVVGLLMHCTKRHVHRRLQARVTRSPQKLAHYQTVSYLGRNGYETGTKRDEGSILVGGHCFKMSVCTFHLLAAWLEHCWDLCLPSLRLPISDDLLTLGRWGHRASNGNKT